MHVRQRCMKMHRKRRRYKIISSTTHSWVCWVILHMWQVLETHTQPTFIFYECKNNILLFTLWILQIKCTFFNLKAYTLCWFHTEYDKKPYIKQQSFHHHNAFCCYVVCLVNKMISWKLQLAALWKPISMKVAFENHQAHADTVRVKLGQNSVFSELQPSSSYHIHPH